MPIYEARLAALGGDELDAIPYSTLGFSDLLGDVPSAKLTVAKAEPKAESALVWSQARELHLYRDGVLVYGGRIWTARAKASDPNFTIESLGYFSTLDARFVDDVDQVFTGAEQLDVAWGLIDYSQSKPGGDLGIIRDPGETPTGITRTITYDHTQLPKIGQSIRDLAGGTQGFDWSVGPDRVWRVWYPQRGQQAAAVIELGKNVQDYDVATTALGARTTTAATGTASGGSPIIEEASSAGALAALGLLEDSTSYSDISTTALLSDLADDDIVRFGGLLQTISVALTPADVDAFYGAFVPGDSVRVRIAEFGVSVDDLYRVAQVDVAVAESGQEVVTVTFDQRAVEGVTSRRRVPYPSPTTKLFETPGRVARLERVR